jgi:hypothetical protein
MPWFYGGKVRFVPSKKSYHRFEQRVRKLCQDLPATCLEQRADEYAHRWVQAFPLWKPNPLSLFYLDMTVKTVLQDMEGPDEDRRAEPDEGADTHTARRASRHGAERLHDDR